MKQSLFVLAALFLSAQSIRFVPEQSDIQIREDLRSNLRQALRIEDFIDYDDEVMNVQLNSESEQRQTVRAQLQHQLREYLSRGDAYPETILPSAIPILPIPSSNPDVYIQLSSQISDEEMTVEQARVKAAEMQAQMDQAIAQADAKRAEQQAQYEASISNNDPASQLQGLMNAQQSLHRLTSAFSAKPNLDKVTSMAQKLGIPMTPELMQLGSNEAISNALVEIAVGMGKSEEEIAKSID